MEELKQEVWQFAVCLERALDEGLYLTTTSDPAVRLVMVVARRA